MSQPLTQTLNNENTSIYHAAEHFQQHIIFIKYITLNVMFGMLRCLKCISCMNWDTSVLARLF